MTDWRMASMESVAKGDTGLEAIAAGAAAAAAVQAMKFTKWSF